MLIYILLQTTEKVDLSASAIETLFHSIFGKLVQLGENIILAVLAYIIGIWIINLLRKFIKKILNRKHIDLTVSSFINSLINTLLNIILVIIIIRILGFSATSLAALLAAAGLAVGMAMKDNLANFAGGVMILMTKPFKVGDYIVAQSQEGTVQGIGILYTILMTGDGKTIYVPNGPLSTGTIVNNSTSTKRRIDITFCINHGHDAEEIKNILNTILAANYKILKEPAPFVGVTAINNGNFDVTIRAWVLSPDYGEVSSGLHESIYNRLKSKGMFVPNSLTIRMADS